MNFDILIDIHELAKKAGVSYAMHYAESDDSWWFSISSIAPSEEFIGKSMSFNGAVSDVIDWLESIIK